MPSFLLKIASIFSFILELEKKLRSENQDHIENLLTFCVQLYLEKTFKKRLFLGVGCVIVCFVLWDWIDNIKSQKGYSVFHIRLLMRGNWAPFRPNLGPMTPNSMAVQNPRPRDRRLEQGLKIFGFGSKVFRFC